MGIKLSEVFRILSEMGLHSLFPSLSEEQLQKTVEGITSDSREVREGWIFVAIKGEKWDGHDSIEEAIQKGACLIVGERELDSTPSVPYLRSLKESRYVLAILAAKFYKDPSETLLMVGVTGTSGKTTTTYLIESILNEAGYRVGVIGTVNCRFGQREFPSTHTTPGPVELQRLLNEMKNEGCTAVVMEVSSHALKQSRVHSIAFDVMVFTNLSPEHLDFHKDMEDYFYSKSILFTELALYSRQHRKKPIAIINQDDAYGQRLIQMLQAEKVFESSHEIVGFSILPHSTHSESFLDMSVNGIMGRMNGVEIRSKLTGQFNGANIAAAGAVGRALQFSPQVITDGIACLRGVPGRLERVVNSLGIHIWVDYAHKPDALEKVTKTLSLLRNGNRLITVFGCGGDRDRQKRPLMGKIAVLGSDFVFITSDNPRTENPNAIIEEILKGVLGHSNFTVEVDRKKAIRLAIEMANSGDLVLIAGKGHENYQIVGQQKIHFDDREEALDAISRRMNEGKV